MSYYFVLLQCSLISPHKMAALLSFCTAMLRLFHSALHTQKHFPFNLTLQVLPQHKNNQTRDQLCDSSHYRLPKQHLTQHSLVCEEQHCFTEYAACLILASNSNRVVLYLTVFEV